MKYTIALLFLIGFIAFIEAGNVKRGSRGKQTVLNMLLSLQTYAHTYNDFDAL